MNNTKNNKNGFRIVWFMYVEVFISFTILTIGLNYSLIMAVLIFFIGAYLLKKGLDLNVDIPSFKLFTKEIQHNFMSFLQNGLKYARLFSKSLMVRTVQNYGAKLKLRTIP